MRIKIRSWIWKIQSHSVTSSLIALLIIAIIILIILIALGYVFNWSWTGLDSHPLNSNIQPEKTLWDWMQLLIIPLVLAIGGYLLSLANSRSEKKASTIHDQAEREIAQDNQREAVLQDYIDKMSELLLNGKLRVSQPEGEVRIIARVRTLTTLTRLDGERKRSVVQFLYESGLIYKDKSIIDLEGADLTVANLNNARLLNANLSRTNLNRANLSDAMLDNSDLQYANLSQANLQHASLEEANLTNANLSKANLVSGRLRGTTLLEFSNLKDADLSNADLKGVNLFGAELIGAKLYSTYLRFADLSQADLSQADLRKAILWEAKLKQADLTQADLRDAELAQFSWNTDGSEEANLIGVNLEEANLKGTKVTNRQLQQVRSLRNTTMPNGSIYSENTTQNNTRTSQ